MKRMLYMTIGSVYLAALLLSLVILIKPGAAIFYKKNLIQNQDLIQVENALEIQFKVNEYFYNPETILILQDNKILVSGTPESVKSGGNGTFSVEAIHGNQITVIFAPSTLSADAVNEHTYHIYIRPYLIKSNVGGIGFLVLALGLVAFLEFNLVDPQKRKVFLGSPFGMLRSRSDKFDATKDVARSFFKTRGSFIKRTIVNCILFVYLYVFMEWVFFVTKPSFMDILSWSEKIKILLITGLAVTLLTFLVLLVFFLLDGLLAPVFPSFHKYAYNLLIVFIMTCLCMILIDNFTYTVFKFGIVNTRTLVRAFYGLAFESIFIYILLKLATAKKSTKKQGSQRIKTIAAVSLFTVSLILAGFTYKPERNALAQIGQKTNGTQKPNIILMSTDGVNAEDMSVYGYGRDTTPFISELAKSSLISENNFTNSANTAGSLTAALTGKLPFSTHVLYPPDTLRGADMYQHLPGLLKRNGYLNAQLAVPYYADANALNFQNAFDSVNCVENPSNSLSSYKTGYGYDDEVFLLTTIMNRIDDRITHIFFIKDMQNPYTMVTQPVSSSTSDQNRWNCLRSFLSDAKQTGQPLFVQIHLLGTHGPKFYPSVQVFSKGEDQDTAWMIDFYDDAILSFDSDVQQFVQYLKDNGQYDNTILILYSDHGGEWTTTNKIPLIIHFPGDQHAGTVKVNTQIIDIAPTILDYLGIDKPGWMEGDSLLGNLDPKRLIIAGYSNKIIESEGISMLSQFEIKPPFYQFSNLFVTQCNNIYNFDLDAMSVKQSEVKNYVNSCSIDMPDSEEVIREKVGNILKQMGYHLPGNW